MKKNNTVFQIRINDEDLADIKTAAKSKGLDTAVFIRETMKRSAKRIAARESKK